jgi:hypothetical protein
MKQVEIYARVRHAVLIEGISERAAAERFGINARTVSKMLKFSVPPGYVRKKPPLRPKLDPFTGIIDAILVADKERPSMIGVGMGFHPPLPPNRAGGFPALGSPVGGFFIETVSL